MNEFHKRGEGPQHKGTRTRKLPAGESDALVGNVRELMEFAANNMNPFKPYVQYDKILDDTTVQWADVSHIEDTKTEEGVTLLRESKNPARIVGVILHGNAIAKDAGDTNA